jgi:hypothetical protein
MTNIKSITVYEVDALVYEDDDASVNYGYPFAHSSRRDAEKSFNELIKNLKSDNQRAEVTLARVQVLDKGKKWMALRIVDNRGWQAEKEVIKTTKVGEDQDEDEINQACIDADNLMLRGAK